MGAFVDRYHEAYHGGSVVDLINCYLCQDDFVAWQGLDIVDGEGELIAIPVDRLEEQEVTAARATRMEEMIAAGYSGPDHDNDHTV